MSKAKSLITKEEVDDLLNYCPETGIFTWKKSIGTAVSGCAAGHLCKRGYIHICIKGRLYRAHRLAFLIVNGDWPTYGVDHINGIKNDNRWSNLRDVPDAINIQNKHKPKASKGDQSLPLGVTRTRDNAKKAFRAKLGLNGRSIYLGAFPTKEEAHSAYLQAKRTLHEGCTI